MYIFKFIFNIINNLKIFIINLSSTKRTPCIPMAFLIEIF